jgi:hypothetical protein
MTNMELKRTKAREAGREEVFAVEHADESPLATCTEPACFRPPVNCRADLTNDRVDAGTCSTKARVICPGGLQLRGVGRLLAEARAAGLRVSSIPGAARGCAQKRQATTARRSIVNCAKAKRAWSRPWCFRISPCKSASMGWAAEFAVVRILLRSMGTLRSPDSALRAGSDNRMSKGRAESRPRRCRACA